MSDQNNGTFKVDIDWNSYTVSNDVRWTGDIVVKEQLYIANNKTITLAQNYTPNQHIRDSYTHQFSKTTFLTCDSNTYTQLGTNSKLTLQDSSSLTLQPTCTLDIYNQGILRVRSGSTLIIKNGSYLNIYGSGRIEVEAGGYICIETGAHIYLETPFSVINLRNGFNSGVNYYVHSNNPNCASPGSFSVTGTGAIHLYSSNNYIQNINITNMRYYSGYMIFAGSNVTTANPPGPGDAVIKNGADVIFDAESDIILDKGFSIETGATFETR